MTLKSNNNVTIIESIIHDMISKTELASFELNDKNNLSIFSTYFE